MNNPSLDFLIIGQGLAGSLLAWQLHQQNQKIMVIERPAPRSTSRMAAGLINPVTGKRLVKSPYLEQWLPRARDTYRQLEQQLGQEFFHEKPMLRLFRSKADITAWEKRVNDPAYQPYLGARTDNNSHATIKDTLGGFRQLQTGYLDTVALLNAINQYFQQQQISLCMDVSYDDIHINEDAVHLKNIQAQHIIFCEGYQASINPWFNWLPFKAAKGEILTLKIDEDFGNEIINAGQWLLPLGNGLFKCGSTYEWQTLDEQPTQAAGDTLMQAASHLLRQEQPPELIRHQAGVRPCTKDTMPFIGLHPQQPRLGIFNGFGSKGSLMIPYYAEQFSQHLQGRQTPLAEADIKRYWNNDN